MVPRGPHQGEGTVRLAAADCLHRRDGLAGSGARRLDAVRGHGGGVAIQPGALARQGKDLVEVGGRVHPAQLLIAGRRTAVEFNARHGLGRQRVANRRQPPGVLGVTPLEVQALQDTAHTLFHAAGHKGKIHFGIVAEHELVIKHRDAAITYH